MSTHIIRYVRTEVTEIRAGECDHCGEPMRNHISASQDCPNCDEPIVTHPPCDDCGRRAEQHCIVLKNGDLYAYCR